MYSIIARFSNNDSMLVKVRTLHISYAKVFDDARLISRNDKNHNAFYQYYIDTIAKDADVSEVVILEIHDEHSVVGSISYVPRPH